MNLRLFYLTAFSPLVLACSAAPSRTGFSDDAGAIAPDGGDAHEGGPADASEAGAPARDAGPSGTADVQGTVEGKSFTARGALSQPVHWARHTDAGPSPDAGIAGGAAILIGQYDAMCGGPYPIGQAFFWIELYADASITPGAYPIRLDFPAATGNASQVTVDALYNACDLSATMFADSGSVTITTAGPAGVAGTFDVKLESGETVRGSFDAPTCDGSDGIACVLSL